MRASPSQSNLKSISQPQSPSPERQTEAPATRQAGCSPDIGLSRQAVQRSKSHTANLPQVRPQLLAGLYRQQDGDALDLRFINEAPPEMQDTIQPIAQAISEQLQLLQHADEVIKSPDSHGGTRIRAHEERYNAIKSLQGLIGLAARLGESDAASLIFVGKLLGKADQLELQRSAAGLQCGVAAETQRQVSAYSDRLAEWNSR